MWVFLSKMKHLGVLKCEDRREFAGTSETLSVYVLTGYNFCPAMSLLIQTEHMGCSCCDEILEAWFRWLQGSVVM